MQKFKFAILKFFILFSFLLSPASHTSIFDNLFSGAIQHQLGNLFKLQQLNLGHTGILQGGIFGWLLNLSTLVHLSLNGISIAKA